MADVTLVHEYLKEAEGRWFAVLDGAQFDDLPASLFDGDFSHKPLYLDRGDGSRERVLTAPQFVWLDRDANTPASPTEDPSPPVNMEIVERLMVLVDDRHGAVFWECPDGGEVLYRHLRTINMVLFPKDADFDPGENYEANPINAEDDKNASAARANSTHKMVLFRHADSNVMAQVLPALDRMQHARLFGPATTILYAPDEDWGGELKRALRPDNLPRPPAGPLKLEKETIEAIERQRLIALRLRRVRYLRDTCKAETESASDEALAQHILFSEKTGKELGLVSEAAHARWAFVMCKTNGQVMHSPEAIDYIARGGQSPDKQVKQFMVEAASVLEKRSKGGEARG